MWVAGLEHIWHACTFCVQLHHFSVASPGWWVHILGLSCPGAMWGHWREILPLNWSMLPWCDCWFMSQWALYHTYRNQWFGSPSLGNRAQFCRSHHLCMLLHTSFHWGFRLQFVSIGSSGHALCILRCKFLISLGRVARLLWPWHMPCRIQALTWGWAGYQ